MEENKEIKRLETKLGKELLWPYVLSILKKGPNHAYNIRKILNEKYELNTNSVLTYLVLYKLKDKGYIKDRERKGRVVYTITKKGRALMREGKKRAKEMIKLWK